MCRDSSFGKMYLLKVLEYVGHNVETRAPESFCSHPQRQVLMKTKEGGDSACMERVNYNGQSKYVVMAIKNGAGVNSDLVCLGKTSYCLVRLNQPTPTTYICLLVIIMTTEDN